MDDVRTGYTAPLQMKAAITNAILGGSAQQLSASCPTGNCTWPVTPSLAVCGACSQPPFQSSCDSRICNFTMPSGVIHSLYNGTGFDTRARIPVPPEPSSLKAHYFGSRRQMAQSTTAATAPKPTSPTLTSSALRSRLVPRIGWRRTWWPGNARCGCACKRSR